MKRTINKFVIFAAATGLFVTAFTGCNSSKKEAAVQTADVEEISQEEAQSPFESRFTVKKVDDSSLKESGPQPNWKDVPVLKDAY